MCHRLCPALRREGMQAQRCTCKLAPLSCLEPRVSCCGQDMSPSQRHIAEASSTAITHSAPSCTCTMALGLSWTPHRVNTHGQGDSEHPEGARASSWEWPAVFIYSAEQSSPQETNFFGWRETSTAIAASKCPKPCMAPARLHPGWVLQPHTHACVCGGG